MCHAFGEEGVDRHIMLFKKEYELTQDELAALRRGEEYDPLRAKEQAFQVGAATGLRCMGPPGLREGTGRSAAFRC